MRAAALSILALSLTLSAQAQDVKIKKGTVSVDGTEYVHINDDFGANVVMNSRNEELFTIKEYSYDVPNPARSNYNDPGRFNYPATIRKVYYAVSFLKFKLEFETDLTKKKMFQAFYKYKLLNEDETVNQENAAKIAEIISKNGGR